MIKFHFARATFPAALFAILLVLVGCSSLSEVPREPTDLTTQASGVGDMIFVYQSDLASFNFYRTSPVYADLDWSTDACSNSPDSIPGIYDFKNACQRHDFGYRNYQNFGIFSDANKAAIDDLFLADMRSHCATRFIAVQPSCTEWAFIYYGAVTAKGYL